MEEEGGGPPPEIENLQTDRGLLTNQVEASKTESSSNTDFNNDEEKKSILNAQGNQKGVL